MDRSRYVIRQYRGEHVSKGMWFVAVESLPYEDGDDWVGGDYLFREQALSALHAARRLEKQGLNDNQIRGVLSEMNFGPTTQSEIILPKLSALGYGVKGMTEEGIEVVPLEGRVSPEDFDEIMT